MNSHTFFSPSSFLKKSIIQTNKGEAVSLCLPMFGTPLFAQHSFLNEAQFLLESNPKACELSAKKIRDIFEDYFFTGNRFSSKTMPKIFEEVSELIQKDDTKNLTNVLIFLEKLEKILLQNRVVFDTKDGGYLEKCQKSLYLVGEYIYNFYNIEFHTSDEKKWEIKNLTPKPVNLESFISCFEASKKLKEVGQNLTRGTTNKDKNLNETLTGANRNCNPTPLSMGGIEEKTFLQRIFSRESMAILVFSLSGESWLSALPSFNPIAQQGMNLAIYDIVLMASFACMLTLDKGMGYKIDLQKKLLGDMFIKLSEQDKQLSQLSYETKMALKEFLPFDFVESEKIKIDKKTIFTTTDGDAFFEKFLDQKTVSYDDVKTSLESLTLQQQQICVFCLQNSVLKPNFFGTGKWGTILDHLFSKLNDDDKRTLIKEIPSQTLFGCQISTDNNQNKKIPSKLGGEDGALNYIVSKLTETDWSDRLVGTRVYSQLLFDIFSSQLSYADKEFLIKIVIGKELEGNNRGLFASGCSKGLDFKRNALIGGLYVLGGITAFIIDLALPGAGTTLKLGLQLGTRIVTGAASSTAFGVVSLSLHSNVAHNHADKTKAIKEADRILGVMKKAESQDSGEITIPQDSGETNSIPSRYEKFIGLLEKLKKLQKSKVTKEYIENRETYLKDLDKEIEFFKDQGILDFVLEANHAQKDCPLFEIVNFHLDIKKEVQCKLLLKENKSLQGTSKDSLKKLRREARATAQEKIESFLVMVYGDKNEKHFEELQNHSKEDNLREPPKSLYEHYTTPTVTASSSSWDLQVEPGEAEFKSQLKQSFNQWKEKNLKTLSVDVFKKFMTQGLQNAKTPKAKLLFSLRCSSLLKQLKDEENPNADKCKFVFNKAVVDAAEEKGSLLFDLQKRNPSSYETRRFWTRFAVGLVCTAAVALCLALCTFPPTIPLGVIGAVFAFCFVSFDFAGRKLGERWEYSTRTEVFGKVLIKAHRNYELVRGLVDLSNKVRGAEANKLVSKPTLSAKAALQNMLAQPSTSVKEKIEKLQGCLFDWEKSDREKEDHDNILTVEQVKAKYESLLAQGYDKESVRHTFIRALKLIHSKKHILGDKKYLSYLCDLTDRICLSGNLAKIVQTKGLTASHQYYLADLGLGATLVLWPLILAIPEFATAMDGLSDVSRVMAQNCGQLVFDFAAMLGWIHVIDVSTHGKTKTYQTILGIMKEILLDECQSIHDKIQEKLIEEKLIEEKLIEEKIEEKLIEEKLKSILILQRGRIPSIFGASSLRQYNSMFPA